MISRLCQFPSCNCLAEPKHNYCKKHLEQSEQKHQQWLQEHKPFQNAIRTNSQFYNSQRWRKLRKAKLEINPVCEICGNQSELQVHHIKPPKGGELLFFNLENLQTVCANCHRKLTAKEISSKKSDE